MSVTWQWGLLAFGLLWALQVAGTAFQMRHYRKVLGAVTGRWNDGYVGTGAARGRFGRGVIAIVVTDQQRQVREAFVMQGRTVFAKFRRLPELTGRSLDEIRQGLAARRDGRRLAEAFAGCVAQIERAAA